MGITDPDVDRALHDRWRTSLAVAAAIMLLLALGAIAAGFLYGDHSVVPVPMLLGGLAVLAAVRSVPRAVLPEAARGEGPEANSGLALNQVGTLVGLVSEIAARGEKPREIERTREA